VLILSSFQLNQADSSASKEARIQEAEAKLIHCQATCNRLAQVCIYKVLGYFRKLYMQGSCITFYKALFPFSVISCITHHHRFSYWFSSVILIFKPLSTFPSNVVVSYFVFLPLSGERAY
jgi:hypothetical protein